jgi:Fe2+ transport system protein FeoA
MSFAHLVSSSDGVRSLAALPEGARGTVVQVRGGGLAGVRPERVDRLMALGVTPGAHVVVLQTAPGIVFKCDQTELAVERAVADAIIVKLGGE